MEIYELQRDEEIEWSEYVSRSNSSTFYHQIGWKNVIERTYGHKPIYLIAKQNEEIKGILPLFLSESRVFGKKLVSIPFAPYGGICADDEYTEGLIVEAAKEIARLKNVDFLEIRETKTYNNFVVNRSYVTYIIDLDKNIENVWNRIKRDRRRNIKKANKLGLEINWNATINDFYTVHSRTMRDLGTPVHGIDFFKNCVEEFPNNTKVLTASYENKLIACQLLFYHKDTIIAAWGSSFKEYNMCNADQLIIWEVIKEGCNKGYKYFDFGRCLRNTGVYKYKERWGGHFEQLYYNYYLNSIDKIPDVGQTNQKRRMFAKGWSLLPLPMANHFGPKLRKHFL